MEYKATIGLEIHAELATKTKMFCACQNDPDEKRPNVNICPICLAHPGTLPYANEAAVRQVLRVGLALGGTLAGETEFDRKNYFYPDIPKGYQISQYQRPLVSGGELLGVQITRVHLEEDTARSQHAEDGEHSLVDFNRAGVPLMELVTEPVITSAKQAGAFARELQLLLRYLGASEANLEKGEMRVEANVSLNMGTKVEVKNLNSFRAVERAIDYELSRQQAVIESGEKVVQETRGWEESTGRTFSQRQKESSHDYRYFPDPDLPPLHLPSLPWFKELAASLPELPAAKRIRLIALDIQEQDVELYVGDIALGQYFEIINRSLPEGSAKVASNFIANDLVGLLKKDSNLKLPDPEKFSRIVALFIKKEFNSRQAKDAISLLVKTGGQTFIHEVSDVVGLSDDVTMKIVTKPDELVDKIIAANSKSVADYKAGKVAALQALIGQAMKESKGAANPATLKELLMAKLS